MLDLHELKVELRGGQTHVTFYQKTRAGKRKVGYCVAETKDKAAVRNAIESEHMAIMVGAGSQEM